MCDARVAPAALDPCGTLVHFTPARAGLHEGGGSAEQGLVLVDGGGQHWLSGEEDGWRW